MFWTVRRSYLFNCPVIIHWRLDNHHSNVGKYERGEAVPSIEVVQKIANALEVSIDQLDTDEKEALLKIIDAMISKKILKDNLASLVAH